MKILSFSDWRSQRFSMIKEAVIEYEPDLILYAGDDLERVLGPTDKLLISNGQKKITVKRKDVDNEKISKKRISRKAKGIIKDIFEELDKREGLANLGIPFYYVNGNDDKVLKYSKKSYLHDFSLSRITPKKDDRNNVLMFFPDGTLGADATSDEEDYFSYGHEVEIYLPIDPLVGYKIIKIGKEEISIYGSSCTYGVPSKIEKCPNCYADIYLSHIPPYGCLDLSVRFGLAHIGAKKLRNSIIKHKPKVVVFGHSHIWGGKEDVIGETRAFNTSSNDKKNAIGNYVMFESGNWQAKWGIKKNNSYLTIPGITHLKKMIKQSVDQISFSFDKYLFPPNNYTELINNLREIESKGIIYASKIRERVESTNWRKPRIVKKITFDPQKQTYVDVETGLLKGDKPGKLWLIGVLYQDTVYHFRLPEEKLLFIDFLRKNKIDSLASWTNYDKKVINPLLKKVSLTIEFIDACRRSRNCIIWHTYALDNLHKALFGGELQKDGISGVEAGLYADHLIMSKRKCKYCPKPEEVAEKIIEKNRIDLFQMKEICLKTHSVSTIT